MLTLREARMEDLQTLGEIAFATGYFGSSAQAFFPDKALFTDLWVRPYLTGAGCCNFVAQQDEKLLGYIIGTCDMEQYQRWIVERVPSFLWNALRGKYPQLWPSLGYLSRMARFPSSLAPFNLFPAQLHINLLSESRGLGLGSKLLEIYIGCLRAKGVRGVQLSTTRENQAAIALYQKFGFRVYREYPSPLWQPWLGRSVVHVVMTLDLTLPS